MDQLRANEVAHAVASVSKVVPNIKKLLSPIINTAHKKQSKIGNINLQELKSAESGV